MKSGLFIGQKLTVSEVRKRQHFVYSSNHMNTNVKKEYGLIVHQRFKDLHKKLGQWQKKKFEHSYHPNGFDFECNR
ncbi:unnamed protein product [Rhizophagus irregularis]|uniref:Uncharacterized protein n=2 Tax=Rhizophagus irregularis TaxID=588596 RepID=A0A915Z061_9GLOM|nr:unnamed protein product [Rhizophagus irregularis]CAB5356162.1 unnamed protein product [Rhizophagus irregularis]